MCKGGDVNPMEQESSSLPPSNEATGRSLQSQSGSNDTRQSRDAAENSPLPTASLSERVKRRSKRDKDGTYSLAREINLKLSSKHAPELPMMTVKPKKEKKKRSSKALMRHGKDSPSGGMEALLPSFIGLGVLVFAVMAQRGFRGRATVAGIDLGTTNSVICVQAPSKSVGEITCVVDPHSPNGESPIVPSVVAFLEPHERKIGPSSKIPSKLDPHPSHVVVGHRAKQRIDSHPRHTFYNAKRVLGRAATDEAVRELKNEVEFNIVGSTGGSRVDDVYFQVDDNVRIPPQQIGSYVVHHLMQITKEFLGHDNVNSAVLAVPAKFNALQRQRTIEAFQNAGVNVARVLEEPTAAALAYGLHKKEGVEKILVYDFGGGTLDVSILHVSEGYCEVMGSDGDDRLGGADFDAAVAQYLIQQHPQMLSHLAVYTIDAEALASSCDRITEDLPLCSISSFHTIGERLKIALSQTGETASATCLAVPPPEAQKDVSLESICHGLYVQDLQMTLDEYNKVSQPLFDRSILPMTRLLDDLSLKPDDIDEIVMVGGTTRMPQIRALVRDAFSAAQMNVHIDPDITVAYGAASVID